MAPQGVAAASAVSQVLPTSGGEAMTRDDERLCAEIMDSHDPATLARLLYAYYHDADRADRTARSFMYLHLGMLCGAVMAQVDKAGKA